MMKDIGAIALAGFFVHSGYLIAWSTFRRQKNEPLYGFREFFTDRLVRVYIALIPCMVVLVLVTLLGYALVQKPIAAVGLRDTIGTLLMLENNPLLEQMRYYFQSDDGSWLFVKNYAGALPLWTLVIEWWIYMAFGWWILVKQKRKWWYWPLLLFFLIEPAWQTFVGNRLGPGLPIFWLLGVVLVFMLESAWMKNRTRNVLLSLAGFIAMFPLFLLLGWKMAALSYFIFVSFAVLALNNSTLKPPRQLDAVVRFGAGYTLTLYILHYPMAKLFSLLPTGWSAGTEIVISILAINIVSILVALPSELKYKHYRKKLYRRLGWQHA
mgnify:CR=1 FL=1